MFTFKVYRLDREVFCIDIKHEEILSYFLDYSERGFTCHVKRKQ